ncbi:MAG: FAD:protein FMN transferase [Clostridia bacterium]|nr:FAD:protein FMN transferase [Clostridia bacterium]
MAFTVQDCFKEIGRLEKLLSRTIEGSDVDRINRSEGKPVTVSDDTIEVLTRSLYYSKLSEGAFDVSIGKVSSLYNFRDGKELPDKDLISDAVKHIDYEKIVIDGNTVTLLDPEMMLDLGAIAKGYISEKLAEYMIDNGISSGLINLGGNIVMVGSKRGEDFRIGVRNPESADNTPLGSIKGEDLAIITSGTYERYIMAGDRIYHHILDPDTGYSAETDLLQVTIIADRAYASDCDALSTTLLLMGSEKGMEFIKGIPYAEAVFLKTGGEILCSSSSSKFEIWS